MVDLQWPNGVLAGITHLLERSTDPHYCHDENMRANKLAILGSAYLPFRDEKVRPNARLHALAAPDAFKLQRVGQLYPDYFDKAFPSKPTSTHRVAWPYTYSDGPGSFWVDFADTRLGGGVFGNGFLQEETMCCEIPELANAAGLRWLGGRDQYTLYTRDKDDSPSPLVLLEARRTVNIHDALREKDEITKVDPKEIGKYFSMADQWPVNVLAMATRQLPSRDVKDQTAPAVIYDLFNTFVAGFTLACEHWTSKVRVNTGPIGTGDFNNNIYLVYILQVLAARYVEIDDIFLLGYEGQEGTKAEALLKRLDEDFTHERDKTVLNLLNLIPNLNIPAK